MPQDRQDAIKKLIIQEPIEEDDKEEGDDYE